jgi:hypothetical protein
MTQTTANSSSSNNSSRCQQHLANGTRCRSLIADNGSGLCFHHAKLHKKQSETADLSTFLIGDLTEFKSAVPINDFLSRLLRLLAENRIAPRRAAVMAYITNQLLRTLAPIDQELNPEPEEEAPLRMDFGDLPRPRRAPQIVDVPS